MMRNSWIFAAVLLTATLASAQNDEGRHTHDGFFLRLQLGGGYNHADATSVDLKLKGGAAGLNAEIGGAVTRNFILYGKLSGSAAPGPDIEAGAGLIRGDDDVSLNFSAIGLGASYYLMPSNFYVSGALSFTQLSISVDGETLGETDLGGALHLGLGKEWWVSDNWGLGLGAEVMFGRIRSDDTDDDWNTASVMIMFSATYN
ncbi:Outer membrane protein beta-barrel domain-containing protein [Stigmatella aurantiaca]|uniref:Outer membrane protein beta-barrel domain-containing protein n=1 Tax=Stigmatella aurantiaca TaxID=41 RepID=A0A1H7VZ08_STIAU|nr:outer membrane beta-barrel protein [Stigmatella aurantiaca]SEM14440.1 Outer membrane protein beta-barrel domain-containing protein [Stigmatella aurantiaca]